MVVMVSANGVRDGELVVTDRLGDVDGALCGGDGRFSSACTGHLSEVRCFFMCGVS